MRSYVVFCHPTRDSFIGAALDRVLTGLDRAGHEVRITDLYADGFRPELAADELPSSRQADAAGAPPPALAAHADIAAYLEHLHWCDTVVFVYPTWWSGQPAMLKGWFDRVWAVGASWERRPGTGRDAPPLRNVRTLVSVTSHGSSKWVNGLEGETGKRTMTRSLRTACSRRVRTRWIAFYGIDRASDAARRRFLDRVEDRLARLGS